MFDTRINNYVDVLGEKYKDNMLMPDLLGREFASIGYKTLKPQVLDASDFSVPQRRRRVIFLAYLSGQTPPSYPTPTTPNEDQKVTVSDAIIDLISDPSIRGKEGYINSPYQKNSVSGRTQNTSGGFVSNYHLRSEEHTSELQSRG